MFDSTIHDTNTTTDNSESNDVLDSDDSGDFDKDDEVFDDDDADFQIKIFLDHFGTAD